MEYEWALKVCYGTIQGSHDVMCDTLSTTERHTRMNSSANRKESDSQDKPTMAVKGIAAPTSRITKAREQKVNQTDNAEVTQESSESNKTINSPTVGVVSPMLNQNRTLDAEASSPNGSPNAVDCQPSSSKTEEKKKPPVPSRACSRLETTFDREVSTTHVPAMAPIRQPPAYHQLIQEGKINGDLLGESFF
uniref:Uncharacterized protein n=1 Tax=Heterorhabditis bacteriophora TaxID=37862 RepID=A0A1I7XT17_HETBA